MRSQDERGETGDAAQAVTALYREHALDLTRLAFLMLGDQHAAEDVVQDAFCGLYRAWDRLPAHDNMLGYVRVSVLNGCRSVLRRARRAPRPAAVPHAVSAEADALAGEEQRAATAAAAVLAIVAGTLAAIRMTSATSAQRSVTGSSAASRIPSPGRSTRRRRSSSSCCASARTAARTPPRCLFRSRSCPASSPASRSRRMAPGWPWPTAAAGRTRSCGWFRWARAWRRGGSGPGFRGRR